MKYFTRAGQTTNWKKGARVKGNTSIQPGTAITVYDQWNDTPLHTRQIKFKGHGYVSNDVDQFYVIE